MIINNTIYLIYVLCYVRSQDLYYFYVHAAISMTCAVAQINYHKLIHPKWKEKKKRNVEKSHKGACVSPML